VTTLYKSLSLLFSVTDFTELLGNGFQRWTFPFLWVLEMAPASATSYNTLVTVCLQTLSPLLSRLSTRTLPGLTGNGSWSSLYSLGTENTAFHSSSTVACVSVVAFTRRLLSHCLATSVSTEPFLSNSCLCWLHNSGFQQTCHNTYIGLLFREPTCTKYDVPWFVEQVGCAWGKTVNDCTYSHCDVGASF
jgi:hypothetical protein